jgi:hypothetical protein
VVLEAQGESPAAQEALENLCRAYWRPIYGFARREGAKPEQAKDITQGFIALVLERKDFHSVRQEKGRLRSFLLASFKHFMANERRGLWEREPGSQNYSFREMNYRYDGNGTFIGSLVLTGDLDLTDANSFIYSATIQLFDPNGNLLTTLCGRGTATRFE